VIMLFGRNPVVVFIAGIALLVGGLALHATFLPWIGGALLLSLEILVAADLIRTVAVSPTLRNVLVLGLIVLIRTFLSFSLEVEIEGVLPWRRALASGAGAIRQASRNARGPDAP